VYVTFFDRLALPGGGVCATFICRYDDSHYETEGVARMVRDGVLLGDWHVVARTDEVREGKVLSRRLLGEDLVLWRPRGDDGPVAVWQDLCIHRGARLSMGSVRKERDGTCTLACPYHGWRYDSSGRCVHIPAHPDQVPPTRARAEVYAVQEKYGFVWVCLGEPRRDIAPFPEWDDPFFRKVFCGPYRYAASGPRAVENFLDVAHFPFVHGGLLGDEARPEIEDYEVVVDEGGIEARDIRVFQPDPDGTGQGKTVTYTYRVPRPLSAYLYKEVSGERFAIFFAVTPVSELESIGWMWVAMNYAHELSDEEVRGFQDRVTGQDVPVVESQRPELLPLDLQAELHLRSDRTAIAYRKWLRELGLSFGVA